MEQQIVKWEKSPLFAHFEKIISIYDAVNKEEVLDYVNNNRQIIPSLFEINEAIKEYFPGDQKLKLELVKDPDIEDLEKLFIYIPYEGDIKEVYRNFRKFNKEWFLKHYKNVKGLLNIDLEYL